MQCQRKGKLGRSGIQGAGGESAGENIIVQGETGNTFYIMFSGTVDVFKDRVTPCHTFLGDKRVKEDAKNLGKMLSWTKLLLEVAGAKRDKKNEDASNIWKENR